MLDCGIKNSNFCLYFDITCIVMNYEAKCMYFDFC